MKLSNDERFLEVLSVGIVNCNAWWKRKEAIQDAQSQLVVTQVKGNTAKLVETSTIEMMGFHGAAVEPNRLCFRVLLSRFVEVPSCAPKIPQNEMRTDIEC